MKSNNIVWAFFGTSNASVIVLDELKEAGFIPALIVTGEDKAEGRHMTVTPPPVKRWAEKEHIPYLQPQTLKNEDVVKTIQNSSEVGFDLFVLFSYGKIIPQSILDLPRHGILNLHPSLLPTLRGPSPIKSAILTENETGVTIIKLDSEMDHGPIIAQKKVEIAEWPPYEYDLEQSLSHTGGKLLAEIIPKWIEGTLKEIEQDHSKATYCKKIQKEDGEMNLADSPEKNLRKIRAYHRWPRAYFFAEVKNKPVRVVVHTAHIEQSKLIIDRITPEGKKEMNYADFVKTVSLKTTL